MLNGTNMLRKDNPRWIISNALETIKAPGSHYHPPFDALAMVGGWIAYGSTTTVGTRYGRFTAWLIGLPRRAGRRLFAMNDAEAGWHRWQVTELRGGLARAYRDPRFDLLAAMRAAATPEPDPRPPDRPPGTRAADPPGPTGHRHPGDWDDGPGWPRAGAG